jgi:hypothetical protein
LTGDWTNEIGFDDALGSAAITAHDVPVVTFFARVQDAVAATRTGIGQETRLRNVGRGTCIRYRDGDSDGPAGALIDATPSGPAASGPGGAVATHPATNDPDLAIAGSQEKPKAHCKAPVGQAPKGPIWERKGKGCPPRPSTIVSDGIGSKRMHTSLVPRR